jgi:hypothetical protein
MAAAAEFQWSAGGGDGATDGESDGDDGDDGRLEGPFMGPFIGPFMGVSVGESLLRGLESPLKTGFEFCAKVDGAANVKAMPIAATSPIVLISISPLVILCPCGGM